MKRILYLVMILAFITAAMGLQSCNRKTGCPAYETTKVKTNRKGELSKKGGNLALFPKEMSKKKRKKKG